MAHPPRIAQAARPAGVAAALRDWKAPLVLAALAALFFWKILLGGAWLWEDMMYFSYPVRVFAATSMAMGHLPLWNPYTFGGMPFLADIQTAVLYLPCAALALFVRGGALPFYWLEAMVIAHYVLAGWTMFLLARALGQDRAPALFAGAAYMLSGFMIAHAIHQQIITMAAWFPLIALLFRSALTGGSRRSLFLCALVLGHSTFAGYPQLSLFLHLFLFAYFLFLLFSAHRGRALLSRAALAMTGKAALIVGLGLAIAAIQLLPTQELAGLSQRAQITYEKSTEGSLAWSQLLTLVVPRLFGAAGAGGSTYWGPGTYWYYWETCVYPGILPLMLALLSAHLMRRNRAVAFFWGVALFTIMFALGPNFILHRIFQDYVPGFSKFRNPARICVFLAFAGALLAGYGLQALRDTALKAAEARRFRLTAYGAAAAGALLWFALGTGMLDGALGVPASPVIREALRSDANRSFLFILCSGALILALLSRASWSARLLAAAPLLLFADMYTFGADQNTSAVNPDDYFRRAAPVVRFLRAGLERELFRVNTRNQYGMVMDRNQGMVDRIFTLEGYTPLVLQRADPPFSDEQKFDLMNVRYYTALDKRNNALTLAEHATYLPRAFLLYDVRVTPTEEEELKAIHDSTWDHRRTALLPAPLPFTPAAPAAAEHPGVRIASYSDNRIELDAENPGDGLLVLSEVFYPGWKAYVDGTETGVLRADYLLRAIPLRRGSHRVLFVFAPPPFEAGAWISGAALLLCVAGIALRVHGKTPRREKGD